MAEHNELKCYIVRVQMCLEVPVIATSSEEAERAAEIGIEGDVSQGNLDIEWCAESLYRVMDISSVPQDVREFSPYLGKGVQGFDSVEEFLMPEIP